MYFFVNRSLSPIQKGIQAGHCALEYARIYHNDEYYKSFIENDKTWIILEGGTSQDHDLLFGTCGDMEEIVDILEWAGVSHATFREPDVNYALTAVCFLCDERVWDKEQYPDYVPNPESIDEERDSEEWVYSIGGLQNDVMRGLIDGKRLAS